MYNYKIIEVIYLHTGSLSFPLALSKRPLFLRMKYHNRPEFSLPGQASASSY
jgi:hypothetical protein